MIASLRAWIINGILSFVIARAFWSAPVFELSHSHRIDKLPRVFDWGGTIEYEISTLRDFLISGLINPY